jgi:hypothetical protein
MKEVRRIKFTGKNLNDVFALPCVTKIVKKKGQPRLVIDSDKIVNYPMLNIASIGDDLVEYDNGEWDIIKPHHFTTTN